MSDALATIRPTTWLSATPPLTPKQKHVLDATCYSNSFLTSANNVAK